MSENTTEPGPTLDPEGDSIFAGVMDLLASEGSAEAGAADAAAGAGGDAGSGAAGDAAAAAAAAPAGGPADTGAAGPTAGAPTAGDGGTDKPADGAAAAAGGAEQKADAGAGDGAGDGAGAGGTDLPGRAGVPSSWTVDASTLSEDLGKLTTALEDKLVEGHRDSALTEMREEYANYFDAADKPARMLVGMQVPALGKEGMETIQSTQDARDWQEAVKSLLVDELRERTTKRMESESTDLNTVHASVKLFQDNRDLIPGTKDFDIDLANRVATMLKPYEHRVEGKLRGYTIPTQPIIDNIRASLVTERAATPAAASPAAGAAAPAAAAPAPAAAPNPDDQPQAGITSKAGATSETDDMTAFWGTLGLPNLQL